MLSRGGKLVGVRAEMLVAEGEASSDACNLQEKRDALQLGTSYDLATGIANNFGGSMCVIYVGHLLIPASRMSVILFLVSSSPSAW